jgi:hypothetical protein
MATTAAERARVVPATEAIPRHRSAALQSENRFRDAASEASGARRSGPSQKAALQGARRATAPGATEPAPRAAGSSSSSSAALGSSAQEETARVGTKPGEAPATRKAIHRNTAMAKALATGPSAAPT